mmetsp:Transcript_95266/g.296213  ORF Transcript_95266/g.296213 Transcript_95266/m.296213 type:complete len:254 (+) Transcript_95266:107-868(+)
MRGLARVPPLALALPQGPEPGEIDVPVQLPATRLAPFLAAKGDVPTAAVSTAAAWSSWTKSSSRAAPGATVVRSSAAEWVEEAGSNIAANLGVGVVMRDGYPFCQMCRLWADEGHLRSKKHCSNVEWYEREGGGIATEDAGELKVRLPGAAGDTVPAAATVVAPARMCAWCSNPALDREIAGTRARYCASCWEWWQNAGADDGASAGLGSPPLPPPVGQVKEPLKPPADPTLFETKPRKSEAMKWIDGDEIMV